MNPPSRSIPRIVALLVLLAALGAALGCASWRKKSASLSPEELYEAAREKLDKKKYYSARLRLQEALPRIPPEDQDLLPKVQLAIADSFYHDGGQLNFGEALNAYRNFLTYFPDHEMADYAQFMVGMSLFEQVLAPDRDQSLTYEAIGELRRLETRFPYSSYVMDARRTIELCNNRLAEHERLIGRFYQRRKAWSAAIDRYQQVVDRFPSYDGMSNLLLALGTCLLEIGDRPRAEEAFHRLSREDPEGKLSAIGQKRLADYDEERAKQMTKAARR